MSCRDLSHGKVGILQGTHLSPSRTDESRVVHLPKSQMSRLTAPLHNGEELVTSPESWHACSLELSGSRITALTIWFRSMGHRNSQVFPHKIFWKEKRNNFRFFHSFGRNFTVTCLKTNKPQSRKHPASGYFQCFHIILSVWVLCFDVAEN